MRAKDGREIDSKLANVKIGNRLYSELSPLEMECLQRAASAMLEWIMQEAGKKN